MLQGQVRGSGSGDVASVTGTVSRGAAISLWKQTPLDRRKSASGALDLEARRSNDQLQHSTNQIDHGMEATAAMEKDVSEPEHRTGKPVPRVCAQ